MIAVASLAAPLAAAPAASASRFFVHADAGASVLASGPLASVSRGGASGSLLFGWDFPSGWGFSFGPEGSASFERTRDDDPEAPGRYLTYGLTASVHLLRGISAGWRVAPFLQAGVVVHSSSSLADPAIVHQKGLAVVRGGLRFLVNDPGARMGLFVAVTSYLTSPGMSVGVVAGVTIGLEGTSANKPRSTSSPN